MFQYFIYDEEYANCYEERGAIYGWSSIYTKRGDCERNAIETCNELNEEFETQDRFKYAVIEQHIVD